jgi:hypothetical protein
VLEDDRLALSVTTADGGGVRWGGDEPNEGLVPADLEFGSAMPGGYKDLSCSLLRRFSGSERLFDRVRAYGPGNRTAFDGRLVQFPRADLQVNPGAVGHSAHMRDDPSVREIYVDQDKTHWEGPTVQRKLNLIGQYTAVDPAVVLDVDNGRAVLALTQVGDWAATAKPAAEAVYRGGGIPIGALYYAWKRTGNIGAGDPNWSWSAFLMDNADATGASDTTGNMRSDGPFIGVLDAGVDRKFAGVFMSYGSGPAGLPNVDYSIYWTSLGVYGTHALPRQGVNTDALAYGFYGHDIILDLVSRWASKLNATIGAGSIEPNTSFVIPQAAFFDPTTVADAVMLINGYFLWEWGVFDDLKFFWRAPSLTRTIWTCRRDLGARASFEGETGEAQFNGVLVRYTDANGQRKLAGPPAANWQGGQARCDVTNAVLVDTSPENVVNRAGIPRKWGVLEIGPVTTDEGAVQLGFVWLAEHRLPQRRGSIQAPTRITHPTEGPVPTWRPRAGDSVTIEDLPGDEPRRIIETRYRRGSDAVEMTVGNTDWKIDAILERIGISLVSVTG